MATLIKPSTPSPDKAHIEHVLELIRLGDIDPNLFTNARPLWHPPGARGIYGGAVIAQCLAAAQRTVPDNFTVHSMHCYFVLAGNAEIPVIYSVERVREGKSFCTRTVQARQRGKPVFTTTLSFMREGAGGKETVSHAVKMADDMGPPPPDDSEEGFEVRASRGDKSGPGPFVSRRLRNLNNDSPELDKVKARQWIKARGKISDKGGFQAHLNAIAYMSDSYFMGTVARVHRLWRYGNQADANKPKDQKLLDSLPEVLKNSAINPEVLEKIQADDFDTRTRMESMMDEDVIEQLRHMKIVDGKLVQGEVRPEIAMMVSLDHTIYFHSRDFRADEWMYSEMDSPWAANGRGFVTQKIYSKSGKLIASCVQEGVLRLKPRLGAPKL
ncbi:Thioesterase/thiol ester dehydrase-isomerase [Polychaeton citri CBS 116435]|uniref:Thioesterase/thiol ester dehydrase-isomerase n=1 Tax=Polychaeton citri CBS 116435 TaxID=1314669 RepID=A0A9P4QKB2_9PEZI|nr:Thioesterase/thiol ester dehydrase-isomerase [Polychaeton citri CBS 116435]